jgi:hypothetical protein
MSITKESVVDRIEVTENGCVHVRTANRIFEDGVLISQTLHRHVVLPGSDFSGQGEKVKAICQLIQTEQVISNYQTAVATAQGV